MSNIDTIPSKSVVYPSVEEFQVERIFPIRNLVNGRGVDTESPSPNTDDVSSSNSSCRGPTSAQEPYDKDDILNDSHSDGSSETNFLPPPYPPIPPDDQIRRLPKSPKHDYSTEVGGGEGSSEYEARKISQRSQLIPSKSGPPGIAPGEPVSTEERTFFKCEDEPIHIPGAIQQYGALIALRYNDQGDLMVRIASENAFKILKYTPEQLFSLNSFLDLLGVDVREDFIARVDHALRAVTKNPSADTKLDIFSMSVVAHTGLVNLWCAIHISKGTDDLIICEFEPFSDEMFFPDEPHNTKNDLPKFPTRTIDNDTVLEERLKSISSGSQPLRVLQIAKRKGRHAVGSLEVFNAMTQAQEQLAACTSVQKLQDVLVGLIFDLTGFHRVMFYRFDSAKNGCVEAELLNPKASDDIFRGLHFPASDIPKQALDLYKINRIRMLHDRDEETARLVCRHQSDFEKPLDLTHAYLRAMSPLHLKYLSNMGVRSTMSVSIVINGDLWALLHAMVARNIGECASTNIERLLMRQRIEARRAPRQNPGKTPSGFIAASSDDLLKVFDADFGLLNIQDEARAIGRLRPYREALSILAYLQSRHFTEIFSTHNITKDLPKLKDSPAINSVAGILVIPLSTGGNDFLVFFRRGQLREVRWAGNPYEKIKPAKGQYLEPRSSFSRWTQTIKGTSKIWNADDFETASVLSLLYGRFIEIWRQKESTGLNRMTRLLLKNTSHEVRTPLNAVVNYLEMALEDKIESPTRELLEKAHRASRSLVYVIDDLLKLTKAETGPVTSVKDVFDLSATVSEVMSAFQKEAVRKNLDLTVTIQQGIPEMVRGDATRLRQVISNITSNAFQNSVVGGVKIDIKPIQIWPASTVISLTVQDVGIGMSESQLDELFQEFEQILDETDHSTIKKPAQPLIDVKETLGIGLAVVARYVRNSNGQIRVHSEVGKGTIFGIELPFEHAPAASNTQEIPIISTGRQIRPFSDSGSNYDESDKMNSSYTMSNFGSTPLATPIEEEEYVEPPSVRRRSSLPFLNMIDLMSSKKSLSILIAEDNPINSKLLHKRLSKLSHKPEITAEGQSCYDYYTSGNNKVDVILMDLQMPLVDGTKATRMIRKFERDNLELHQIRRRVPIIAASASLLEEHRFDYIEAGFDGWIMKPINFSRLEFLLQGLNNPQLKQRSLYTPGIWELGGWFFA
ncbi:Cyanobacterial phytochrome B [Botrytis cinerea]